MTEADGIRLAEDIRSGAPARVGGALRALQHAWLHRATVPFPLPPPDCLDAFGPDEIDEMLDLYLSVVRSYSDFEPTPSGSDLRRALVEAGIAFGGGRNTLPAALQMVLDDFPEHAILDGLGYLGMRGLHTPDELRGAEYLLERLVLDVRPEIRAATLRAVGRWVLGGEVPALVAHVRRFLDPSELAELERIDAL